MKFCADNDWGGRLVSNYRMLKLGIPFAVIAELTKVI